MSVWEREIGFIWVIVLWSQRGQPREEERSVNDSSLRHYLIEKDINSGYWLKLEIEEKKRWLISNNKANWKFVKFRDNFQCEKWLRERGEFVNFNSVSYSLSHTLPTHLTL